MRVLTVLLALMKPDGMRGLRPARGRGSIPGLSPHVSSWASLPLDWRRVRTSIVALLLLSLIGCSHAETSPVPSAGASVHVGSGERRESARPLPTVQPMPSHQVRRPVIVHPIRTAIEQPVRAVHGSGLPTSSGDARTVRGVASWYCGHGSRCTRGYVGGLYAAAGPALRVGQWRGRSVVVHAGSGRTVRVTLIDWCACPARALDLYSDAFSQLVPLSQGLVKVTVSW